MAKKQMPAAPQKTPTEIEIEQLIESIAEDRAALTELRNVLRLPMRKERTLAQTLSEREQRLYKLIDSADRILYRIERDGKIITAFLDEQAEYDRITAPYREWLDRALLLLKAADKNLASQFEQQMQEELEAKGRSTIPAIRIETKPIGESTIGRRLAVRITELRQAMQPAIGLDSLEQIVNQYELVAQGLEKLVQQIPDIREQQLRGNQ